MAATSLRIAGMPSLVFATMVIALFSLPYLQAYAHVGEAGEEAEEQLVMSKYIKGNIDISVGPESEQWKQSTENIVESEWQHEVQVMSLNNGTYIFFLLSWDDATKAPRGSSEADGAAIFFETTQPSEGSSMGQEASAEESDQQLGDSDGSIIQEEKQELWYWSTDRQTNRTLNSDYVITKAEWDHDHWYVLMGRQMQAAETVPLDMNNQVTFKPGEREEGFVKFVVWDGAAGESFDQVDEEKLSHLDFVLLPEIDTYPKDVYAWSGILVAGTVLFFYVELRLYGKRAKTTSASGVEQR